MHKIAKMRYVIFDGLFVLSRHIKIKNTVGLFQRDNDFGRARGIFLYK